MADRDNKRVVLAEDDMARAAEWRELLETLGGYEVWVTKRKDGIVRLLEETNSRFLIQDLELEDGNSADMVPVLRERFGRDIFIMILSGYYEDYPEYGLLAKGADVYFRKPYEPKALLQQMDALRVRLEGQELKQEGVVELKVRGGILNLDRGVYIRQKNEVIIPGVQVKLLKLLSSARDDNGWAFVERGEAVRYIWADDYQISPATSVERLRKLRSRLKKSLGFDVTETRTGGTRNSMSYRLTDEVELVA